MTLRQLIGAVLVSLALWAVLIFGGIKVANAETLVFGPSRTAAPAEWWEILDQARNARTEMLRWDGISDWHTDLASVDDRTPIGKVSAVDILIRRNVKFLPERDGHQRWKLPELTRAIGGDCEDWATLAFVSLAALGFDPDEMRIWGVWSERHGMHAVLYVKIEGEGFLVDSIPPTVAFEDSASKDYELRWELGPEGKTTYLAGM